MGFLSTLANVASGGLVGLAKEAGGLIEKYFPPDMTPEEKAELKMSLERLAMEKQGQVDRAIAEAEASLNERIKIYEGTASDLKTIPVLGPIMLFLRGAQRVVWGFACLWMDWQWFTAWETLTQKQEAALVVINVLVLGFLFGERAVKNVAPVLTEMFTARKG